MIDSSFEIPWNLFKEMREIKGLPLNEQIKRYNFYVQEHNYFKYLNWMDDRGGSPGTIVITEGFLQQEDLYYILQEDGSRIYVTIEVPI